MFGMDAAERGVERHLTDRDAHSSRSLIAEAEDAFTVADNNAFDAVVARMAEDLRDAVFIGIAEEEPARLTPDLAESLAVFADGRGVNEGQKLFDVTYH